MSEEIASDKETTGDDCQIECPVCEKMISIHDDCEWARPEIVCHHCDAALLLSHNIDVTTWVRKK